MTKTKDKKKTKQTKQTNSQKHRQNLRDQIKKKKQQKYQQNVQKYDTAGYGGAHVITRTKEDIRNAPAMKGEKIKRGGFQSTFPVAGSGQGFFDKHQIINDILSKERTRNMAERMVVENATRYNLNEEQTKELIEKRNELQRYQNETKQLAEIQKLEDDAAEERRKIEGLRGSLANMNKKRYGKMKTKKDADIRAFAYISKRELEETKGIRQSLEQIEKDEREKDRINERNRLKGEELGIRGTGTDSNITYKDVAKKVAEITLQTEDLKRTNEELKRLMVENAENTKRSHLIQRGYGELHATTNKLNQMYLGDNYHGVSADCIKAEDPKIAAILAKSELTGEDLSSLRTRTDKNVSLIKELQQRTLAGMQASMDKLKPMIEILQEEREKFNTLRKGMYQFLKASGLPKDELEEIDQNDFKSVAPKFMTHFNRIKDRSNAVLKGFEEHLDLGREIITTYPQVVAMAHSMKVPINNFITIFKAWEQLRKDNRIRQSENSFGFDDETNKMKRIDQELADAKENEDIDENVMEGYRTHPSNFPAITADGKNIFKTFDDITSPGWMDYENETLLRKLGDSMFVDQQGHYRDMTITYDKMSEQDRKNWAEWMNREVLKKPPEEEEDTSEEA